MESRQIRSEITRIVSGRRIGFKSFCLERPCERRTHISAEGIDDDLPLLLPRLNAELLVSEPLIHQTRKRADGARPDCRVRIRQLLNCFAVTGTALGVHPLGVFLLVQGA